MRVFYERVRRGEGRLDIDHDDRISDEQEYLSGVVETTHAPGIGWSYRGLRTIDVDLEARALQVRNPGNDPAANPTSSLAARVAARLEF